MEPQKYISCVFTLTSKHHFLPFKKRKFKCVLLALHNSVWSWGIGNHLLYLTLAFQNDNPCQIHPPWNQIYEPLVQKYYSLHFTEASIQVFDISFSKLIQGIKFMCHSQIYLIKACIFFCLTKTLFLAMLIINDSWIHDTPKNPVVFRW